MLSSNNEKKLRAERATATSVKGYLHVSSIEYVSISVNLIRARQKKKDSLKCVVNHCILTNHCVDFDQYCQRQAQ